MGGSANGIGTAALFWGPYGTTFDPAGNLYVADSLNKLVRVAAAPATVDPVFSTLAGRTQALPSASPSAQAAAVTFATQLVSPGSDIANPNQFAILAAALLAMRCDYALLSGVRTLSAVSIVAGAPAAASASSAALNASMAIANAGTACPRNSRILAGAGARALPGAASEPWATFTLSLGWSGSAAGAAAIAAAVEANSGASFFPLTTAVWAPSWGMTSAAWVAAVGSPMQIVSGTVAVANVASYSPVPTSPAAAATNAQLGIGLGVGIGLAVILGVIAVVVFFCCRAGRGKVTTLEEQAEVAAAEVA